MGRDRSKAREELLKRTQESNDRKDGDVFYGYFKTDQDLPLWKASVTKKDDEPHLIDIIPFYAGKNFPQVDPRHPVKEDDLVYLLETYVHQNIGPGKESIICPARNYKKPCPICEEIEYLTSKEGGSKEYEDYADIALKRRCAYNIVCYDSPKEEGKGVQIWEVSYKYGEKKIQLAAKNPRGGGVVPFADYDVGKLISFEVAADEYRTIDGHKLVDRDYVISEEIEDSVWPLDELVKIWEYNEIYEKFYGELPAGVAAKEENQEESVSRSSRGRGGVTEQEVPPPSDPAPLQRRSRAMEEPVRKDKGEGQCPCGGEYGIDIDQLTNCDDCKAYDACALKAKEIEDAAKVSKETAPAPDAGTRRANRRSRADVVEEKPADPPARTGGLRRRTRA
ncbi:MAG: hypothetical protein WC302_00750 [Candidatus Paceibacterota bacterium]|jgi:hypothetical protein